MSDDVSRMLLDTGTDAAGCNCCASAAPTAPADATIDPVCGMSVDPARAAGSTSHLGRVYHFCARGCQRAFGEDPDRYLTAQG